MDNPSSQGADGLHLLRTTQLLLKVYLFTDIAPHGKDTGHLSISIFNGSPDHLKDLLFVLIRI